VAQSGHISGRLAGGQNVYVADLTSQLPEDFKARKPWLKFWLLLLVAAVSAVVAAAAAAVAAAAAAAAVAAAVAAVAAVAAAVAVAAVAAVAAFLLHAFISLLTLRCTSSC
jgi:hypothetical protein